jgi:hypothetical protein
MQYVMAIFESQKNTEERGEGLVSSYVAAWRAYY